MKDSESGCTEISSSWVPGLREVVRASIRECFREEMEGFTRSVIESQFYRDLAMEMRDGIHEAYETIAQFKKTLLEVQSSGSQTETAFHEVSDQLEAVVKATEQATNRIMDLAEGLQGGLAAIRGHARNVSDGDIRQAILAVCDQREGDILEIFSACSFQDITGQRVKKAVDAVRSVEKALLRIMVSAGVRMRGKELGQDEEVTLKEKQRALDLLTGPQEGVQQKDVDSILAELGF